MIVIFERNDLRKKVPKNVKDMSELHLPKTSFDIFRKADIAIIKYNGEFKVIKNRYINRVKGDI